MRNIMLTFAVLLVHLGWAWAQQAPVAGIAFNHLSAGTNHYDFVVHLDNNATGNPTNWEYRITMTGCATAFCTSYGNASYNSGNPIHTVVIAPPGQTTFRVWQLVSNAYGADTAYVDVPIICSNLTPPFSIYRELNTTSFPVIYGVAHANIPFEFIECSIYGAGLTTPQKHSYSSSVSDTAMLPGPIRLCGYYYRSVCTGNLTLCDTFNIPCWRNPVVEFDGFDQGSNVLFTDSVVATAGSTWLWDFGDGTTSTSNSDSVMHSYLQPGTYTVCLTVEDTCGITTTCHNVTFLANGQEGPLPLRFDVAPNPTRGPVSLNVHAEATLTVTIQVLDAQSRLLQTKETTIPSGINSNLLEMPTTPGIYLLRIQDSNGRSLSRSIVVQ